MASITHNADTVARALALEALQKGPGPVPSTEETITIFLGSVEYPGAGKPFIPEALDIPAELLKGGEPLTRDAAVAAMMAPHTCVLCRELHSGSGGSAVSIIFQPSVVELTRAQPARNTWMSSEFTFTDTDGITRLYELSWPQDAAQPKFGYLQRVDDALRIKQFPVFGIRIENNEGGVTVHYRCQYADDSGQVQTFEDFRSVDVPGTITVNFMRCGPWAVVLPDLTYETGGAPLSTQFVTPRHAALVGRATFTQGATTYGVDAYLEISSNGTLTLSLGCAAEP